VIGVAVPDRVETDLVAGAIACPGCGGALRPWGHARARRVRDLITTVALRPRRARCSACRAIHRRIAADLARPAIAVRRWLRAVRGEHAEWLRAAAIERLAQLDRDIISTVAPTGSRLGDVLNAVAAAALAHRARLAPHVPIWDLVPAVTRWRLLPLPGA
jgi:hypothetical protein